MASPLRSEPRCRACITATAAKGLEPNRIATLIPARRLTTKLSGKGKLAWLLRMQKT